MPEQPTAVVTPTADSANSRETLTPAELRRRVIDPQGVGLAQAIAADIAAYTGEAVDVVLTKMATGKDDLKRLWEDQGIDQSDENRVVTFYRDQFVEAYELADWHCGRTNGTCPLSYAHAALFARRRRLTRALDFGSGIG